MFTGATTRMIAGSSIGLSFGIVSYSSVHQGASNVATSWTEGKIRTVSGSSLKMLK